MDNSTLEELVEKLTDKTTKYKKIIDIKPISKPIAVEFVGKYHYLGDKGFFSAYQYGAFYKGFLIGVASFAQPQGARAIQGWFPNNQIKDANEVMELQRLALYPPLNGTNLSSFLLGRSIKEISKEGVRAITTLADSTRHVGSIYQVTNFSYYGLTAKKSDFYVEETGKKVGHGLTKGVKGVYIPRAQKHRYAFLIDKSLVVGYPKVEDFPKKGDTIAKTRSGVYTDKRLGEKTDYYYNQDTDSINKII